MKHILLTRPSQDAADTARILQRRGYRVTIASLSSIDYPPFTFDPERHYDGIIITSQNAVRGFCQHYTPFDAPVFCVGDETADLARKHGFTNVMSAQGSATDVFNRVIEYFPRPPVHLLRLYGDYQKDRLTTQLKKVGFTIDSCSCYSVTQVDAMDEETVNLIKDGKIDGVCFFSAAAAKTFYKLVKQYDLTKACRNMTAWCISETTAAAIVPLSFQKTLAAVAPNEQALLDLI